MLAYEVGSKNRFFDDRLQVDIDMYLYNYKDYQVDQLEYLPVPNGPPAFGDFITNAAKATHKGVELTTEYLLTDHDTLTLNAAYLSAAQFRSVGLDEIENGSPLGRAGSTLDQKQIDRRNSQSSVGEV